MILNRIGLFSTIWNSARTHKHDKDRAKASQAGEVTVISIAGVMTSISIGCFYLIPCRKNVQENDCKQSHVFL